MYRLVIDRELQPPPVVSFANMNSLIYREPAHQLIGLKPGDKNLYLKFIVLGRKETINTKKGERIHKFIVADATACIDFNIFGESGEYLKEGDVCYVNGVYCSLYHERMLLYQGKGILRKIGEKYLPFETRVNMSEHPQPPF